MKSTYLLFALLWGGIFTVHAQEKYWEEVLPDAKQSVGLIEADLNNPNIVYISGDYTARAFNLATKKVELLEIGRNICELYFASDENHNYSFLHSIAGYNGNNHYTTSLLYSSKPGVSKGLREAIFSKERYMDFAGLRLIDGKLHVIMGDGDPFNKKPASSNILVLDENSKTVSNIPVAFPKMAIDKAVESRSDKGRYTFGGNWKEVAYDAATSTSVIFRLSQLDKKAEAGIFSVDLKTGDLSKEVKLELPSEASGTFVCHTKVNPMKRDGKDEFVVEVLLNGDKNLAKLVSPQILLIRYSAEGELLGSQAIDLGDMIEDKIDYLVRNFSILPTVNYDPFAQGYVLVWNYLGNPFNLNMVLLDGDLKMKKILYPSLKNVTEKGASVPSDDLPIYWKYYYEKGEASGKPGYSNILFGEDFVVVKHYNNANKNVTVTCFK